EAGVSFYDATHRVAALAVNMPSVNPTVADEYARIAALIDSIGTMGNPLEQSFTTWDGLPAVRGSFDFAGVDDMKKRIDAVATVGNQVTARVQAALLDFQTAGVSTGWYPSMYNGSFRDWTGDVRLMLQWFSPTGTLAWGTSGDGSERGLLSLQTFLEGPYP